MKDTLVDDPSGTDWLAPAQRDTKRYIRYGRRYSPHCASHARALHPCPNMFETHLDALQFCHPGRN